MSKEDKSAKIMVEETDCVTEYENPIMNAHNKKTSNYSKMFSIDYKKTGKIIDVQIIDDKEFNIIFENVTLTLFAEHDCCSESWFEFPYDDLESIIGESIENIYVGKKIKLPESKKQEVDINNLVIIELSDGTDFEFVFRNSSNGYYSGWLEIECNQNQ